MIMKNLKAIVVSLMVMTILVFAGCRGGGETNNGESQKDEKEVIKIGAILPLTGELASYGDPMKKGIEMALEQLNSREDNKYKFKLKYFDSKAEQATAISALQNLINVENVKFVIGDVSSSTTLAMIPVAEQNKVFLLSPGASSPKLNNISPFFARNYPSSVEESIESAKFIFNTLGKKDIALIYVNNEYGLGLAKTFEREYQDLGGKINFKEAYQYEQSDFRTLISKLETEKPSLIYLAGNQKEMGKFMKQYAEAGLDEQIVSNISFLEPDCLDLAGAAANGVIVPVPYYNPLDSTMKGAYEFGKLYKQKTGELPTVAPAVGYDALMLMAMAFDSTNADPVKSAKLIRNLKTYDGAMGEISFTNGDVSVPVVFKVVKNGETINYEKGQ